MSCGIELQTANVQALSQLILSIPEAQLLANVGSELSFRLPMDESASFPAILSQLETRRAELGVHDYGISVTTLEDVFLKVAGMQQHGLAATRESEDTVVTVSESTSSDAKEFAVDVAAPNTQPSPTRPASEVTVRFEVTLRCTFGWN